VKRRNDPTSAKVSTILGSYDRVKELVTSSHMIGAILQPATPCPSVKQTFEVPSAPPRSSHKHSRNGVRPELSRQGVFEQFQRSAVLNDETTQSDVASSDKSTTASKSLVSQGGCGSDKAAVVHSHSSSKRTSSSPVANGRHRSSASSDSKHRRLKLAIPSPKVCQLCVHACKS